jgi:hypothetical protein
MKMIIKTIKNVLWVIFALGAGLVGGLVVGAIPLGLDSSSILLYNTNRFTIQTGLGRLRNGPYSTPT